MACGHIKVSIKSKRLCMTYAQRLNMLMKNMLNGPIWVYIQANWKVFHLYSNQTDVKQIINVLYQSPELVIEAINIPENRFVIHVPDQRQESANKNTKPGKTQRTSDEH